MTRKLVLATNNPGKAQELDAMLAGLDVQSAAWRALSTAFSAKLMPVSSTAVTPKKFRETSSRFREAVTQYIEEVRKMLRDINTRFVRARFPDYAPEKAEAVIEELERTRGSHRGLQSEDLLYLPDPRFFRRKGEPAFQMIGIQGEAFTDVDAYLRHLAQHLNDGYVASRDMRLYAETLRKVVAGELTVEQGVKAMPKLKRVGGTCPCSKSVRWVMEESNGAETTVMTRPA